MESKRNEATAAQGWEHQRGAGSSPHARADLGLKAWHSFLADWFKTVLMEDSENGGKGEMQERNRNVVYLLKVEREGFTTGRQSSRFSIQVESLCF